MKSVLERMAENNTDYKIAMFRLKQKLPYETKLIYAERRIFEFYNKITRGEIAGNCHVSVGGLDSLVLNEFLRHLGINVPAISVSSLEDKSIQRIHKEKGIIRIRPLMKKVDVIREFGFPVLSKEIAGKIMHLQNPTPENATVRHAIMTGETGAYGGWQKNSRMKLAQCWLELFGGPENEKYGTSYKTAPFKISDRCCYYLKEKPCDDWAKENQSYPFLGLMASEGGRRQKALMMNGCNYYGASTVRSAPFAIFNRQDILQLALDLKVPVPDIYGEIKRKSDGTLYTTRAQRTGCSMCGFGIQREKRPHRFDRLYEDNPKEWRFWMHDVGWGEVLDYIGVEWRQNEHSSGQLMWFPTAEPAK